MLIYIYITSSHIVKESKSPYDCRINGTKFFLNQTCGFQKSRGKIVNLSRCVTSVE